MMPFTGIVRIAIPAFLKSDEAGEAIKILPGV